MSSEIWGKSVIQVCEEYETVHPNLTLDFDKVYLPIVSKSYHVREFVVDFIPFCFVVFVLFGGGEIRHFNTT